MLGTGDIFSILFGDSGTDPAPFRGPGWENQGELLNAYMMGQFMTPQMLEQQNARVAELQRQLEASGGSYQSPQMRPGAAGSMGGGLANLYAGTQYGGGYSGGDADLRRQLEQAQKIQGIMEGSKPFFNDNRFTPGQQLAGQIAPTTGADMLGSPAQSGLFGFNKPAQPGQMQTLYDQVSQDIPVNFTKRNPYQFQSAEQMVGDAFTPQYEMANRLAQREGGMQRQQIAEDMNRRGMLSSGMTTRAMQLQQRDQGDRLSNLASQLASGQAQQMLGAKQYQQSSQAEEMFRQQGATDTQAQFLAQMAMQKRQQQMAQQQNILGAQQQAFGQQQAGRQQGIQEWSLQQQQQRLPMEDLFRLYQLSTGGQPGSPASPGLLQAALPAAGSAIGGMAMAGMLCLPKGTQIKTKEGFKNVEDVKVGDDVDGGTVMATFQRKRDEDHRFYLHKFADGSEVVMSKGHPFFDKLAEPPMPTEHDSPYTYDILTDDGYYYVNGVKLGSTLDARFVKHKSFFEEVCYGL